MEEDNAGDVAATLLVQLQGWSAGLVEALPRIGVALVVLALAVLAVAIGRSVIARLGRRLRPNLVEVLQLLLSVGVWLVFGLVALTIVFPSITPGSALATLGLGSVAIGFAFKETFENFLAGILILLREPFKIGDFVECDSVEGQIERITIRDTRLRQTDGQLVVVPNHDLFHNPVVVRTDRDLRRAAITVGVAYGEDVDAAREVIADAIRAVDSVRDDVHDVQVFAKAFASSSIDFEVAWWTGSTPLDIRSSRDQVVAAIKRALDESGIEIPFPYRTLTFKEPLALGREGQDGDRREAAE
ncbi:small-conductance mechanosensitive channel [Hasllibacter halocynthiae]|uniref:Small-conductance mechanosensitive channel n=1 Tax=Hasllibacter halocynthiae TaxID=595589 RepID=A0A2T0X1R5_9RHOB|nr:mechanosensitive ion channel family protein [Hasllibacter halocynthiae]PRY92892.1 small-conductance mechanosensitive channel [Hasllibacter halocynthiae]